MRIANLLAGAVMLAASTPTLAYDESYDWTGFYAGLSGGYHLQHHKTDFTGTDNGPGGIWSQFRMGALAGPSDAPEGLVIGGQLGYNHQIDVIVLGIEADLSYMDGAEKNGMVYIAGAPITSRAKRDIDYFGTLRARFGFLPTERLLLFATGGLAFGNSESSYSASAPGLLPSWEVSASSKATVGHTVGGGLEYSIADNWTIKGEYLYYDLGTKSWTGVQTMGNFVSTITGKTKHNGSMVRLGFNFRF